MVEVVAVKSFPHINPVKVGQKITCSSASAKELMRRGLVKLAPAKPVKARSNADPVDADDKK